MKTLFPFIFLCFFCTAFVGAQTEKPAPKHSLKVGFGTAYLNSGNYFGKQQYLEYDRRLFKLMSIGLNASRVAASQQKSTGFEQSTKAYQGEATLFISPVNNEVNSLKLGFGGAFRHSTHRFNSYVDGDGSEVVNKDFIENTQDTKGLSVMLEYEIFIARNLVIGARTSFQKFDNAERVFFFGLNAGLRF